MKSTKKQAAAYLNDASRLEGGEQEHEGQAQKENIEQGWVHSSSSSYTTERIDKFDVA